jgi:transcription factor C subunit 7
MWTVAAEFSPPCAESGMLTCWREFFGKASWEHPTPPDLKMLSPLFENLDLRYVSTHIPESKGETIVELHERVSKALNHIITSLDTEPELPKTVLICTHAATMIAAGRCLTGRMPDDPDEDDFKCFTAGLSKYVRRSTDPYRGVTGNWNCELNSETSYLSGGAERGW